MSESSWRALWAAEREERRLAERGRPVALVRINRELRRLRNCWRWVRREPVVLALVRCREALLFSDEHPGLNRIPNMACSPYRGHDPRGHGTVANLEEWCRTHPELCADRLRRSDLYIDHLEQRLDSLKIELYLANEREKA